MMSSNGKIFRITGHLCGNSLVHGEFSAKRPVTRSFDVFFDVPLNKRLSKQSRGWRFETLSLSLWRHRNEGPGLTLNNDVRASSILVSLFLSVPGPYQFWMTQELLLSSRAHCCYCYFCCYQYHHCRRRHHHHHCYNYYHCYYHYHDDDHYYYRWFLLSLWYHYHYYHLYY